MVLKSTSHRAPKTCTQEKKVTWDMVRDVVIRRPDRV
jgi:hypothetical protein